MGLANRVWEACRCIYRLVRWLALPILVMCSVCQEGGGQDAPPVEMAQVTETRYLTLIYCLEKFHACH